MVDNRQIQKHNSLKDRRYNTCAKKRYNIVILNCDFLKISLLSFQNFTYYLHLKTLKRFFLIK